MNELLTDTENAWFVAFVSPTCGSCHELADRWNDLERAAQQGHSVRFAYVDTSSTSGKDILRNYTGDVRVRYTPTILLYGQDKSQPEEYVGNY